MASLLSYFDFTTLYVIISWLICFCLCRQGLQFADVYRDTNSYQQQEHANPCHAHGKQGRIPDAGPQQQ